MLSSEWRALRVLVLDAHSKRAAEVARAADKCGLRLHRRRWLGALPVIDEGWSHVAALGLPDDPAAAFLEGVRRAAEAGFRPVCYAHRASRWPLRDKCQILLAGATHIFDSAEPDFLPVLTRVLVERIAAESRQRAERSELQRLQKDLGIVGESAAMQSVFRRVRRISQLSDLAVLLVGETGTGKELLARAVGRLDPKRRHGPFVAINCNTLNENLAESELFGHRSGAFTGALRDRKGLFRAAQGGVLLLDEIGDLALPLQGKLLRVLQEGSVLGLGEDAESPVDVRVIAATNRDLRSMVREGTFREDLHQRLSLLVVHIPPLRERPEDLRPLSEHFVGKHAGLCGVLPRHVSEDFLEAVRVSGLPGNARQLENLVRSALLEGEDDSPIGLSSLPSEFWRHLAEPETGRSQHETAAAVTVPGREWLSSLDQMLRREEGTLADTLQQCERILLQEALRKSRGNQSRAARLLGVTPRSVYNKLRKHKLIA